MWQSQSGGQTVESNAKSGGDLSGNSTGLGPYGVFFSGDIVGGEQAEGPSNAPRSQEKNRALGVGAIFPYAVERVLFRICLMLIALDIVLLLVSGTKIVATTYLQTLGIVLLCMAIATFYHVSGRSPHMAVGLRGMALLIVFSAAAACFNYLLLPISRPSIDPLLVKIDAIFGYHWPNVIAFAADNYWFNLATNAITFGQ